jgi:hypothetical protein
LVTNVYLNYHSLLAEGDYATLYDATAWRAWDPIYPQVVGKFGLSVSFRHSTPYELTQVGDVPANAQYLSYHGAGFEVRIQDQLLQPLPPGSYLLRSGALVFDVARFVGQAVKLSFKTIEWRDPFSTESYGGGYLDNVQFITELPRLSIGRLGGQVLISWPSSVTDFYPQARDSLVTGPPWAYPSTSTVVVGDQNVLEIKPEGSSKFFRLLLGTSN